MLPSTLERDVQESCGVYCSRAQALSIRTLRILRSGATAALEICHWRRGGYCTFVLGRADDGWQAVAIPGGPPPVA